METPPAKGEARERRRIIVLFASVVMAALFIRSLYLLLASDLATWLSPGMDAEIYRTWAEAILRGTPPPGPWFRAPFYPQLIAHLAQLFGGDTFWPIRVIQVVISSLSAGVLALLARRWFGTISGWVAGMVWACYGMSIYFDCEGLIASLFTSSFILLLGVLELDRTKRSWMSLLLAALLLGWMTGLRANALLWWPLLLGFLWWHRRGTVRGVSAACLLAPTVSLVVMLAMVLPILLHNQQTGGGLSISTQGGINLYLGNHRSASGAFAVDPVYGKDWTQEEVRYRAERVLGTALSDAEVSQYYSKQALRFWQESPGAAVKLTGRKLLLLLNAREIANNRVLHPFLREVHALFAGLAILGFPFILILGTVSIPYAWRTVAGIRPALLFAGLYALSMLAFFITARYRFPLTPVLVLLSGVTVQRLAESHSTKPASRTVAGTLLIAVVVASVSLLIHPLGRIDEDHAWKLHQAHADLRLGRFEQAEIRYKTILKEGYDRDAALNLGVTLLKLARYEEARDVYQELTRHFPGMAQAWNNLGVAVGELQDDQGAEEAYRTAVRIDPQMEDARLNLARVLTRRSYEAALFQQDITSAILLLDEALRYHTASFVALHNRMALLAEVGDTVSFREARKELDRKYPAWSSRAQHLPIENSSGLTPSTTDLQHLLIEPNP